MPVQGQAVVTRIIPVIDILDGVVVRGVAGDRSNYRPIVSRWTTASDPLSVAQALRPWCTHRVIYLADLDGILHGQPHWDVYARLAAAGFEICVDAGWTSPAGAQRLLEIPGTCLIAGLESLPTPQRLAELVQDLPADRVIFSLDLRQGHPIFSAEPSGWSETPREIVEQVVSLGLQRLIVLDLADVGTSRGGSTFALCQQIRQRFPNLHLIAGGGVRGPSDLARWQEIAVDGVLVASAIHDGRLGTGLEAC